LGFAMLVDNQPTQFSGKQPEAQLVLFLWKNLGNIPWFHPEYWL
jgi:hypothetical protein